MILIFENDLCKCDHYPEKRLVIVTWKETNKALSFEDYKIPFNKCLEYQARNTEPINFFISDIRNQNTVSPKYRKWFQSEAIPKAKEQGTDMGAVVMDTNVFKRYYINHIMKVLKVVDMEFKTFPTVEKAIEWFQSSE